MCMWIMCVWIMRMRKPGPMVAMVCGIPGRALQVFDLRQWFQAVSRLRDIDAQWSGLQELNQYIILSLWCATSLLSPPIKVWFSEGHRVGHNGLDGSCRLNALAQGLHLTFGLNTNLFPKSPMRLSKINLSK